MQKVHTNSKILNNIALGPVTGFGIGWYKVDTKFQTKIWIAPFGDQLDFMNCLNTGTYRSFMDVQSLGIKHNGLLHYIGYFPNLDYHQLYFYHGKNNSDIDDKLKHLDADYFGTSVTLNDRLDIIKANSYAMRVPFDQCVDILKREGMLGSVTHAPYLNLSYRFPLAMPNTNDFVLNYLIRK